jgi:hypothetical protein
MEYREELWNYEATEQTKVRWMNQMTNSTKVKEKYKWRTNAKPCMETDIWKLFYSQ